MGREGIFSKKMQRPGSRKQQCMVESVRRPIFLRGRCDAASVATNKARLTVRKGDLKGPKCQARNRILVVDGGGQGDHREGPCITPGLEDSSAGRIKRSRCVEDTEREVINQACVMESEGPKDRPGGPF